MSYSIEDLGDRRVLKVNGKDHPTLYSEKIIEAIVKRKGAARATEYLTHKKNRQYYLTPLFKYLDSIGAKNLRVLEVGCSSGHITECLQEEPSVSEIYSFDVDNALVEVAKIKRDELKLDKVKSLEAFTNKESKNLPYPDGFFDVVICLAVLEHLPYENRYEYVDHYYSKLKVGGYIGFFETPNRHFFLERHTVGLPFIAKMSEQTAFLYTRLTGKLKGVSFPGFVRHDTAWRDSSYYECLPRTVMMDVEDVSEQMGYGYLFQYAKHPIYRILFAPLRLLSKLLKFPTDFYLPTLNIMFKKTSDLERT